MKKIIVFLNAYTQGVSGGDLRFIEIAKRIFPDDILVVTSSLGKRLCIEKGLRANYFITTKEKKFKGIISTYLKRIYMAGRLLTREFNGGLLIYSTSDFFPDVIPAFLLKLKHQKNTWIQVIHHLISNPSLRKGNYFRNSISFLSQRISLLLIRAKADKIIAIGPLLADKLKHSGFKDSKIAVGYNGINLKAIAAIEIKSNIARYDAVFIGRLHPSKGIDDLLEVWRLLKEKNKGYTLAIIGKGEAGFIRHLSKRLAIYGLQKKVFMPGYVKESQSYLKAAKVFVFPSYEEGWGISICEALACRRPVIAYDLPVYSQIYNNGIIKVPKGNIEMFCQKVLECIENEDYGNKISEVGSQICQRYDWNSVAEREANSVRK